MAAAEAQPVAGASGRAGAVAAALALLVLLTFSNGWLLFLLGPDAGAVDSALARSVYLPAYAATLGLLALAPRGRLAWALASPLLWALVGLAAISTVWSAAPEVTARRALALAFTTLAAVALVARFEAARLAEILATALFALVVASLVTGLALPRLGRMSDIFPGAWRGVFLEKNNLGDLMAVAAVIFLAADDLAPRRRGLWRLGFVLAVTLVALSTSKTSLVALFAGLAAYGFARLVRRGPALATAVTAGAVLGAALVGGALLLAPDAALEALGKDATLTGRTAIWAAAARQSAVRPWLGWGYGAVWTNDQVWSPLSWIVKQAKFRPFEAHNSWVGVRLELGLFGLATLVAYHGVAGLRALRAAYRSRTGGLVLPVYATLTVVMVTEAFVPDYNSLYWILFSAVALAARPEPRTREARAPRPRPPLRVAAPRPA